jgi:phage-related protein
MSIGEKPLVWLHGEVKSPPLSTAARLEVGQLLRRLQQADKIGMPHSRPMPSVARRCHEIRIIDGAATWRILYRVDSDAIIVLEVFSKKTRSTPKRIIDICRKRLRAYDDESR